MKHRLNVGDEFGLTNSIPVVDSNGDLTGVGDGDHDLLDIIGVDDPF